MFSRLEVVVASASSAQRDKAAGQSSLFDAEDITAPAPVAVAGDPAVEEWSKDDRLVHEKELLGFYVTGHPLDKYRGVIDSERYRRFALVEDIDVTDSRKRHPFAGMVRLITPRVTKTGKPFGILELEDFTGSHEIMLWGETFTPARDKGLLEPGKILKLKCAVQVDDRTGGRRLTGYEVDELKPKRGSKNGKGPVELVLWTTKHTEIDLMEIQNTLSKHPGETPVLLHFQNTGGKRITIEAGEKFHVKRSKDLAMALDRWMEE